MNFQEGEVLYFNKPLHWTSYDLVKKIQIMIQHATGNRKIKIGHAGTLDPLATGILIICTGRATKQIENFQYQTKEYIATLRLGETTPSFDLETKVDGTYETEHISCELVVETLQHFLGEISQVPPVYSAVKINGKRAYEYAREGKEVEMKSKLLVIDEIELLEYALPVIKIRVVCSKGTYIRALARDIGLALQSGAHLIGLSRVRIGNVALKECLSIEEFQEKIK